MKPQKPPRVMRINPKNGAIKLYQSTGEAARDLGLDSLVIANACAKRCGMKTYGGFGWAYTPDQPPKQPGPFAGRNHTAETRQLMSEAKDAKKVPICAVDDEGKVVATYPSTMEAARQLGTSLASPRNAARTGDRLRGFHWRLKRDL